MSGKLHWSGYVYYYLAALIGLAFVLFGLVRVYSGLIQAALPRSSPEFEYRREVVPHAPLNDAAPPPSPSHAEVRAQKDQAAKEIRAEGIYQALEGVGATVVGAPVFLWHIRRARKRDVPALDED